MHADTDLDESGDEDGTQPFSLDVQRQAVIAEPWGITSTLDPSCPASPSGSPQQHTPSTALWQAHWLELRIHALRQQQQRYELRLQKLQQQQDPQAAALSLLPAHASVVPQTEASFQVAHQQANGSLPIDHQQAAGPLSVPHQQPSASATAASQAVAVEAQAPLPALCEPVAVAGTSLASEQTPGHQPAPAVREPGYKHRHSRHPVPGLFMPVIARHPFFCQHSAAGSGSTAEQPAAQGELVRNLLYYMIVKHAGLMNLTKVLKTYSSGTVYMSRVESIMNQVLLDIHFCFPWQHVRP